jgi:hypothetical protein
MSYDTWLARMRPNPARQSLARRRWLLAVAGAAFVVLGVVAVANFPDEPPVHPRWWLLALVAVAGPLTTVLLNGLEYVQQGRLVDRTIPLRDAIRVSVLGTAANLAPVPGSAIVRTAALADDEVGVARAAGTTVTVGVAWLGTGALVAGALQPFAGRAAIGAACAAVGVALLCVTRVLVARAAPAAGITSVFAAIIAVEAGTVIVGALRLCGFIAGLGLDVDAAQAVGLTLAGVLASATGLFPAGIGIREALIGVASPLLELPVAVGITAASADRIAGLVMLGVLSTVLTTRDAPRSRAG